MDALEPLNTMLAPASAAQSTVFVGLANSRLVWNGGVCSGAGVGGDASVRKFVIVMPVLRMLKR